MSSAHAARSTRPAGDNRRHRKRGHNRAADAQLTPVEIDDWIRRASSSDNERGRHPVHRRLTFTHFPPAPAGGCVQRTTSPREALATARVHEALAKTTIPATLMSVATRVHAALPRSFAPVQLTGSLGFRTALLAELGPEARREPPAVAAARADVAGAFPAGDIDLAVYAEDDAGAELAMSNVVLAVTRVKRALDDVLFRTGAQPPAPLLDLDLGCSWRSPFDPDAYPDCRGASCVIVRSSAANGGAVRVDVPRLPGSDAPSRSTPLTVSVNTSIDAGFSLVRLRLCLRDVDGARLMVPLVDVSVRVGPGPKCSRVAAHGHRVWAPSAREVERHLRALVAAGDGDPGKADRRAAQARAAQSSREAFLKHVCRR